MSPHVQAESDATYNRSMTGKRSVWGSFEGDDQTQYLATMEMVGAVPPTASQDLIQWLEQVVIPSEEAVLRLKGEKNILAGGDLSGRRGRAFSMEAASNAEVAELLSSIPQWPLLQVDVSPLHSFEENLVQVRRAVEQMKRPAE